MNKKQLIGLRLFLLILIAGCANKQSYIPFEAYNKNSKNIASDNPAYLKYYDEARRKIYDLAYKNYSLFEQGKVSLIFTISKDGKVGNIDIDENKTEASKRLINIAILALRKASPFLTFPDELKEYQSLNFRVELLFEFENLGSRSYSDSSRCPFDNVEMKEIPIVYGNPKFRNLEEASQGKIILGGDFYSKSMPKSVYICPICKKMWYKKEKLNE